MSDDLLHSDNPFIKARAWAAKYGSRPIDARDGKQGTDDIIVTIVLKNNTYAGKYPAILGDSYYLTIDDSGNWCAFKVILPDSLGEKVISTNFKENLVTISYGGQSWSAKATHIGGTKEPTEQEMKWIEMLAIESLISNEFQKIKWTTTLGAFRTLRDAWRITPI